MQSISRSIKSNEKPSPRLWYTFYSLILRSGRVQNVISFDSFSSRVTVCLSLKSKGNTSGNNISVAVYDDVYMGWREGDRNSNIAGGAVQCFRWWCTFASVYARRPRAPAGVAVRYRSRAAVVVVGSARAFGGACRRPDGTLFFSWLHYCSTAASAFSPRSLRGPRDTHAHDPHIKYNRIRTFSFSQPYTDKRDRITFSGHKHV